MDGVAAGGVGGVTGGSHQGSEGAQEHNHPASSASTWPNWQLQQVGLVVPSF